MAAYSTGLAGLGGLAEGFASAYNTAHQTQLQRQLDEKHQLASTYGQMFQNATPEAQQELLRRITAIYATPPNKKLDKSLSDISTLYKTPQGYGGQSGPAPTIAAQSPQTIGMAPGDVSQSLGMLPTSGGPSGGGPSISLQTPPPGMTGQRQLPQVSPSGGGSSPAGTSSLPQAMSGPMPQPQKPVPSYSPDMAAPQPIQQMQNTPGAAPVSGDASAVPPPYHPFYTPEQRADLAAEAAAKSESAQLKAHYAAVQEALAKLPPGASPTQQMLALGMVPPYAMYEPRAIGAGNGMTGSDFLKAHPGATTTSGQPIDSSPGGGLYREVAIGGQIFGEPAGVTAATEKFPIPGGYQDPNNPQQQLPGFADRQGNLYDQSGQQITDPVVLKTNAALLQRVITGQTVTHDINNNIVKVPTERTSGLQVTPSTPARTAPQNGVSTPPPANPKNGAKRVGGGGNTVIPVVDSSGNPVHAPLSAADQTALSKIDATNSMIGTLTPVIKSVVDDQKRGGQLWDTVQQRSAWKIYQEGFDPANISQDSALQMLPNVDPRLAKILPAVALLQIVGAMPYAQGSRNFAYIHQVQAHLPNPEVDSPSQMLAKLQNLQQTLPQLRNAIYTGAGVRGAQIPAAPGGVNTPPPGGGPSASDEQAIIDRLTKKHGLGSK